MRRATFSVAAVAFSTHVLDHVMSGQEMDPLFAGAVGLAVLMLGASIASLQSTTREAFGAAAGIAIVVGSLVFHVLPMSTHASDPTHLTGLVALAAALLLFHGAPALRHELAEIQSFLTRRYVR